MSLNARLLVIGFCCAIAGLPLCHAAPVPQQDKEQKLIGKIAAEKKLSKKARLEIRLAREKLLQAIDAYDHKNYDAGKALLGKYLEQVNESWKTLQASGELATKHPQAFKDLDINLREDGRLLEELRWRIPYPENNSIEQTATERGRVRTQVLDALFPATHPTKSQKPDQHGGPFSAKRAPET